MLILTIVSLPLLIFNIFVFLMFILILHFYADDAQLYMSGPRMEHSVDELVGWMESNRLLLNPSKTDFLWCATHRRCNQLSTVPLEVCGVRVPPTDTVRDLGILLEADMQMTCHARQLVSRCSVI